MATIVTAAVIIRSGQVLIAQRKGGPHSGKWEFPGGKCEWCEAAEQCLARELDEEFRGRFRVGKFLTAVRFNVGEKEYELQAFHTELLSEEAVPLEHSEIRWVRLAELPGIDLLEPDKEIVKKLLEKP